MSRRLGTRCARRSSGALTSRIDVTHLDTHMGAAMAPPLLETTLRLAEEYRLPVLMPRRAETYRATLRLDALGGEDAWSRAVTTHGAKGGVLVDAFTMTPGAPPGKSEAAYQHLVEELREGLTFVALHPNAPGDIETIVPPRAHYRTDEYDLLRSGRIAGWLREGGVATIGMRPLRDLLRGEANAA